MRKRVGISKRIISLLLVFLFSINSFAAVVSDNDGSAFITKAEFDSLKNSFQSQIDGYNTSIDSKIDGAIASYLAGVRLSPEWNIVNKQAKFLNTWQYKEPQSYYQADVKTSLVSYGINGMSSVVSYDWSFPSATQYMTMSSYTKTGMAWWVTQYLNGGSSYVANRTSTNKRPLGFALDVTGCAIDKNQFQDLLKNNTLITTENFKINFSTELETLLTALGLSKLQYGSATIYAYGSDTMAQFSSFEHTTITGSYSPSGGNSYARYLNEKTVTQTASSADSSSVQVANESGKLFVDSKPYTQLRIQNVVTLDCFHYQDKQSSYTSSSAFADSTYNKTITVGEQWAWNTKYTSGTKQDVGTSTSTGSTPYVTVQNFLAFTKASSQVLKNTTWGRPSYTTNVVMVDDGLTLDKNGGSTQYYSALPSSGNSWTGTGKYLSGSTVTTSNVTLYYPKIQLPKYTLKQYTQQIYDYYSNDFTDKEGNPIKWGEGIRIAECKAERGSSRIMISYHIENMSGTATTGSSCNFELSTKKFVKCVAQSGTSMGTKTVTPSSSTTNTVTFDIGATGENAELWLNAYCSSNNYTVVIDSIAAE